MPTTKDLITLLIDVLQEHSNEIRKLSALNIALSASVQKMYARSGVPHGDFQREFLQDLSSAEEAGPPHDWAKGIQSQIDKALEWAAEMERQMKNPPN